MGQVKAKDLIDRAAVILQDRTNVRWPRTDLLTYLNDAQRQIVIQRPDANAINVAFTCANQSKQTLPAGATRLLTIRRNTGGNAITQIKRETLDTQLPGWHEMDATDGVEHYVYDPIDPLNFYAFPKPKAGDSIDIVYAAIPADLPAETNTIALPDIYSNSILDYMLYAAYRKDATYGDANRAQLYFQAFNAGLGIKTQVDSAITQRAAQQIRDGDGE